MAAEWQTKAKKYIRALEISGWNRTKALAKAQFLLSDVDVLGRRPLVEAAHKQGKKIFLYPHAARAMVQWDGEMRPYDHIAASFVIAEGQAEVMRRYGYPHPLEISGWTYCYQRPFQPTRGMRVLFGPIHPNNNGWLSKLDQSINCRAFEILYELAQAGEIELTVRFLDILERNGLEERPGVRYICGRPDLSVAEIDAADIVVSTQTFLYLAVARGVPTVGIGEDVPFHYGNSDENFRFVASWDKYGHLVAFPLDLLKADDPLALLRHAQESDQDITEWRRLFIGQTFQPEAFVRTIDRYLEAA